MYIGPDRVPGTRRGVAELGTQRTMVAQHDAYAAEDFTGGRPGADGVNQKISLGSAIDAPQLRHDGPEVGPPRLQFSVRHECPRRQASF